MQPKMRPSLAVGLILWACFLLNTGTADGFQAHVNSAFLGQSVKRSSRATCSPVVTNLRPICGAAPIRPSFKNQCTTKKSLNTLASTRGGDSDPSTKDDNKKDSEDEDSKLPTNKTVSQLTSLFWQMASPFYKESKSGRWLFLSVVGLTLMNSGVSVAFSYLGKDFWNALSSKDVEAFYDVLKQYVPALLIGAPVATFYRFQRAQLAVSWREWMTDRTLQIYSSQRNYYALERGKEIDNPDQRIAEDIQAFTGSFVDFLVQFSVLSLEQCTSIRN